MTLGSTRLWIVVGMLAVLAGASWTVRAEQGPQALFERARLLEENGKTLNEAIALYKQVVVQAGTNRALTAQALLRAAECHQKLGDAEAQVLYRRVVTDFADQAMAVAEARVRLAAVGRDSQRSANVPVARLLSGHYSNWDTVTADGRFMTFTDWSTGDAVIRDLRSGEERRPVRGRALQEDVDDVDDWAEDLTFSPDMSELAFSWITPNGNQLRAISAQPGSAARTIVDRPSEFRNFNVSGWSPDGRSLLVTFQRPAPDGSVQLAWVTAATGSVRVLRTFDPWQREGYGNSLGKVSLSPDGRWIAYSMIERAGAPDRHLYLLAADGSRQTRLTAAAGISESPVWTADGRHVLFIADWSGSHGLWSVAVHDGRPGEQPNLVKADIGRARSIGVTTTGTYVYNYQYDGGDRTFIARLSDLSPSAPAAERVFEDFRGGLSTWSPDGARVAFIRQRSSGGRDINELGVRVMATGAERLFTARPVVESRPIWFHSRDAILVVASDTDGTNAFFTVDLATGRFTRTIPARSDRYRRGGAMAALSLDDRTLYTAGDSLADSRNSLDDLIAVDLAKNTDRVIFSLPASPTQRTRASVGLDLSPDGRTLAVSSRPGIRENLPDWSDETALFTVGVDGSDFRHLFGPFSNTTEAKVAWSHDGQAIYFVQSPSEAKKRFYWQIWGVPPSGGVARQTGFNLNAFRTWPDRLKDADPRFERLNLNNALFRSLDLNPDGSKGLMLFSLDMNPKYEVWALDLPAGVPSDR